MFLMMRGREVNCREIPLVADILNRAAGITYNLQTPLPRRLVSGALLEFDEPERVQPLVVGTGAPHTERHVLGVR